MADLMSNKRLTSLSASQQPLYRPVQNERILEITLYQSTNRVLKHNRSSVLLIYFNIPDV